MQACMVLHPRRMEGCIKWDNSKPTTIPYRMVSTDRITTELGFQPNYSFEEGIKETIEWYKNNE